MRKKKIRILITAGATWARVDSVRVLTNIFTGKTGLFMAEEFAKRQYDVTLLINPHCVGEIKGVNAEYYRYFEEFKSSVDRILAGGSYDAIVHSAAVSDYKPENAFNGKIASGKKTIKLKLVPTAKIINRIKQRAKRAVLVQFKMQDRRSGLIDLAYGSLNQNGSDFVVAHCIEDISGGYKGYLIDKKKTVTSLNSKKDLFAALEGSIIRSLRER